MTITHLLIADWCIPCGETTDHEMNAVACEITCDECRTTSPVSLSYVVDKLAD